MKKEAKFEDIFQEQIEDLYDAENQIIQALPKLIAESSSESLAGALQLHLDETKEQVTGPGRGARAVAGDAKGGNNRQRESH